MRKIVLLLSSLIILGCGILLNACSDTSEENSKELEESTNQSEYEGEGGGNPEEESTKEEVKVISILVSADEYIYEEESLELDEILDMVKKVEGEFYVKLKDNKATHKAYSKLLKELQALEIKIEEVE